MVILVVWLCAPALIVAVLAQLWWFRRMRVFQGGHAGRAVIGLAGTVVLTPIVSLVLWMVFAWGLAARIGDAGGASADTTCFRARHCGRPYARSVVRLVGSPSALVMTYNPPLERTGCSRCSCPAAHCAR